MTESLNDALYDLARARSQSAGVATLGLCDGISAVTLVVASDPPHHRSPTPSLDSLPEGWASIPGEMSGLHEVQQLVELHLIGSRPHLDQGCGDIERR